jgi:hypothetical protein
MQGYKDTTSNMQGKQGNTACPGTKQKRPTEAETATPRQKQQQQCIEKNKSTHPTPVAEPGF